MNSTRLIALVCIVLMGVGCAGRKSGGGVGSALGGGAISEAVGKVESVLGRAWLKSSEGRDWTLLRAGDALPKGGLLKTDPGANLEFSLRDGSHVELMSDSSLVIQGELTEGNGLSLYLGGGRVRGLYSGPQLELLTACGGSIELSPKAGASVPFDISNRPPISGGLYLGMGSDGVWATSVLPAELPLVIRSSVAPDVVFTTVPEPGVSSLVCVGLLASVGLGWSRRRS